MLAVKCPEHLAKVQAFAAQHGLAENLQAQLDYLGAYSLAPDEDQTRVQCELYPDFAPYSFAFNMLRRNQDGHYERWFNGGLIFHQAGSSGVEFPVLSVRLDSSTTGWEVHT